MVAAKLPATPARSGPVGRSVLYLRRHAQVAIGSLGRLWRQPWSSLMSTAVIGVALALPATLHTLVVNGKLLAGRWDSALDISVYLKTGTSPDTAQELTQTLLERPDVGAVHFVSADAALEEFREASGFGPALDALQENPLPHALIVRPARGYATEEDIDTLGAALRALPEADIVQQDIQWVRRFHAILDIVRRAVVLASIMLGGAVIIIVGNTIRLDIQNRREEIVVEKLIGASDGFIRRPFLYTGLWYGLAGGVLALQLVWVSLTVLRGPVERVAGLYGSEFALQYPSAATAGLLLAGGAVLGVLGSSIAAARHLRAVEPK